MEGPRCFTVKELEKVCVEIVNPFKVLLMCRQCGSEWYPPFKRGGRLTRGYWRCPNGCNQSRKVPELTALIRSGRRELRRIWYDHARFIDS